MFSTFRDPRYLGPLAVLIGVIVLSAIFADRSGGAAPRDAASVSTTVPAPTPGPHAVRTPGDDEILLDARRAIDLQTLASTLTTIARDNGAYPSTGGDYKPVCFAAGDPTCVLQSLAGQIPASDGQYAYYYRSDGATFTLVAHTQVWPREDNCPGDVPAAFAGAPVFCITGDAGGAP